MEILWQFAICIYLSYQSFEGDSTEALYQLADSLKGQSEAAVVKQVTCSSSNKIIPQRSYKMKSNWESQIFSDPFKFM